MRMLDEFQPRLVGSVLTAPPPTTATSICICSRRSESVAIRLLEIGVPHEFYERRVKMDAERSINYPALRLRPMDAPSMPPYFPSMESGNRPTLRRRQADEARGCPGSVGVSGRRLSFARCFSCALPPSAAAAGSPLSLLMVNILERPLTEGLSSTPRTGVVAQRIANITKHQLVAEVGYTYKFMTF